MMQGQGHTTARKEAGFAMIFRQCLLMTKRKPYPYWHIDLNAGTGHNEKVDCPGSPVVFLDEAERVGRPFNALFCDNDRAAAEHLGRSLAHRVERMDSSTIAVRHKDNAAALKEFAAWIRSEENPQYTAGTCLCDPNGYKDMPVGALELFAKEFRRIDIILNINLRLFRLVRAHKENGRSCFDDWREIDDLFGLRQAKSHWLVRNPAYRPAGRGGDSFAIFLGRNTDKGMTAFEDFVDLNSNNGRVIIEHLKRFNPEQGWLWED